MEEDLDGLGVGGHNDEIADAAIECLGGLVGTLLELLVVVGLLHQIQDRDGQLRVSQGIGLGVDLSHDAGASRTDHGPGGYFARSARTT